jgi:hypothetical protein
MRKGLLRLTGTALFAALVLAGFGSVLTGCDTGTGGGDGDLLAGTWTGTESGMQFKLVAADEGFTQYLNDVEFVRGTYTVSDASATLMVTEVNLSAFTGTGADAWVSYDALDDTSKGYIGEKNRTGTISGTTFTVDGITFTKDGGSGGEGGEGGEGGGVLFAGTWTGTESGSEVKLVAAGGGFKEYFDDEECVRGTYTVSGTSVTFTITTVNSGMFGGEDEWVSYDDLSDTYKGYIGEKTRTVTISGTTITVAGVTFTKEGD